MSLLPFRLPTWLNVAPVVLLTLLCSCSSPEERAQSYYESGVKLLAVNENQKAVLEFRNALNLKKDLMPAWRGLAKAERATQDWQGLVTVLQTILRLDPTDGATRIELAKLLLAGGTTDQALSLINEATDSQDANLLAVKAVIFAKLGDTKAAVREAQTALGIDRTNLDALKVLAADRLANNDPKGALQLLPADAPGQGTDIGAQLIKLKIYEQLGNLSEVETLLRKLTELYPKATLFRKQLIKFYLDQHRANEAENELRKIAAADSTNSEAELDLVRLLDATKSHVAAHAELDARILAGGDIFPYQMALADLDYSLGNAECFDILERVETEAKSPDRALAAKIKRAQFNFGQKKFDLAESLASEILHDDSFSALKVHPDALKLRAEIRLQRGQPAEAVSDLIEALNARPRSAEFMLLLATAYERSGAMDLAEKQFSAAMRIANSEPSVGLSYVGFLRRRGNVKRAEDVLTSLVTQRPNNLTLLSTLADIKLSRQDWAGAQEVSDNIRRMSGNSGIADEILGESLAGEHNFDAGAEAFRNAMAASPSAVQPMVSLVRTLIQAKETSRAVSFLQTVLKSDPENAEAYVLLGSIQLENNARDQAMKSFTTAIDKQPNASVGYRALAKLYVDQGNADAALNVLRAGLKQQPNSLALHTTLAGLLEQLGQYEAAISEYETVLSEQPGSLIATNNLASLLIDHRSDSASLTRAQTLASSLRLSAVPQFKDTLGWVSYMHGDIKTALPLLQDAAAALPDQGLVHYHLAMTYHAVGQDTKAGAEFKSALNSASNTELKTHIRSEMAKLVGQ